VIGEGYCNTGAKERPLWAKSESNFLLDRGLEDYFYVRNIKVMSIK
jgi:hypothetical protein